MFTDFLTSHGISHRISCPKTHEPNGVAEKKHRHLIESILILLAHASMPLKYWDVVVRTSTYLINRLCLSILSGEIPLEVPFKQKPDYSMLKVFGCSCFPNLRPYNNYKLQFHSKECTFLSYSLIHKVFKCLAPNS